MFLRVGGADIVKLRDGCSVIVSHDPSGVNWTSMLCEPTDKFGNTSPDEPVTLMYNSSKIHDYIKYIHGWNDAPSRLQWKSPLVLAFSEIVKLFPLIEPPAVVWVAAKSN